MNDEMTTISKISNIPIGTLAKYEVRQLYELLERITSELNKTKNAKHRIESAISLKYEEQIRAKRLRLEKDSGVIHLEDNGFKLTSEIVKKVEWNQQKIKEIAAIITVNGGNLDDYIETRYYISEHKYNNLSQSIKNLFSPARILKTSKPTFKLTKLGSDSEVAL